MKCFKIWCEWDFGQDEMIFTSEEKARDWISRNFYDGYISMTVKDAFDDGLISIQELTLDP